MKFQLKIVALACSVALLGACGGGGDSDEQVITNKPPVADTASLVNGFVGDAIVLDGRQSLDPENQEITFKWSLISKPADSSAYFDDADTPTPMLSNIRAGTYEVQLIVNDGVQDSLPKNTTVEVAAITAAAAARPPSYGELGFMKDTILSVFPTYLRSPSSFKLIEGPTWAYYDTIGEPAAGAFTLKYDATNGFGAVIRGTAICEAEWDARGFWRNKMGNDLRICVFL